jgi:hypothetical protein
MVLHTSSLKPKSNIWIPVEGITTHQGKPIPDDLDFFVLPPVVIGKIITANSELIRGQKLWSRRKYFMTVIIIGVAIFAGIFKLNMKIINIPAPCVFALLYSGIFFLGTYFMATEGARECSYVGTNGVARYRLKGNLKEGLLTDILKFNTTLNLYTESGDEFEHGTYSNTVYTYQWKDTTGKTHFQLDGSYKKKVGFLGSAYDSFERYSFARSAESSWTKYKMNDLQKELNDFGYVDFSVAFGRTLRVGPGYLEFRWPYKKQKWTSSDFKQITIYKKKLIFEHRNSNFFTGLGTFEIKYSSIPNAQLFLNTLEELMKVDFRVR